MSSVLAVDMSCWLVFPSPIDGWLGDCRLPKNKNIKLEAAIFKQ